MRRLLSGSLILLTWFLASAGNRVKVSGEASYYATEADSPALAKLKAIEQARIAALSNAFGNIISGQSLIITTSNDMQGMAITESDVNGEWLADIKEPEVTVKEWERDYVYTAKVEGWARKIEHDRIATDGRLLYNGTDKERDQLRESTYFTGDEMLYYFTSPVDGWLAIYLGDDDDEQTIQCLLPYDGQDYRSYPIRANEEYVFFSKELAPADDIEYCSGLVCEARKSTDFNVFYAIFSPKEFSGTAKSESKSTEFMVREGNKKINLMPRETNYKNFQKWLSRARTRDPQMQVTKTILAIRRR